jgi:ankyrin repeat protein
VDVIQALLDNGVDANGFPSGSPPLLEVQSVAAAKVLLAAGADLSRLRSQSRNLLRNLWYLPADLAQILIPAAANVDEPLERDGRTALWGAACNGHIGLVNLLLGAGANPAARGNNLTAIECALASKTGDQRSRSPFRSFRYTRDFDAVVAVLQERLKQ